MFFLPPAQNPAATGHPIWSVGIGQDNDNDGTSVSATGFSGIVSGNDGYTDWAEGAITTAWQITPATSLNAELSGRSGQTQEPLAQLSLGIKVDF